MPTSSNTSSPVKRPGLGRRAVSSHAVVTRSTSSTGELSHSQSSNTQHRAPHRPHRPHLVGGGHRTHGRNLSLGKNLNKLQRQFSAQYNVPDGSVRLHQRKKSAPVTPAASPPRGSHHVRWDGALEEEHKTSASMKKNYSSPALRRNNSAGVITKKALVTDRPHSSSGKKKSVGFELVDSDNDDGDWEDTTQSPESTRRGSVVAQSKDGGENPAVLVDPLTFVKRSYPQFDRAASLPESTSRSFHDDQSSGEDNNDDDDDDNEPQPPDTEVHQEEPEPLSDHGDIASRLLSPSHSAKAPPAMSSISATATPAPVDTISRNASLTNIAAGHDGLRRPLSSTNVAQATTPSGPTHATSSSIEGGVSRFIVNQTGTSRTDSDPNTPSSFLPHYHPQTPPSPNRGTGAKKARASPPSRPAGSEPHSRTQQKLWLQRTAALNTSPPDSHGASTSVSPSAMDPAFIAASSRPGSGPFDGARGLVNGTSRAGGVPHQNETKHVRKVYEKTALELTVVRRFQSPTGDSFKRLNAVLKDNGPSNTSHKRSTSRVHPVKSAPSLVLLQDGRQPGGSHPGSPEYRQLISRKQPEIHTFASQAYLQDPEELVNDPSDSVQHHKSQHPSNRLLSTSNEAAPDTSVVEEVPEDSLYAGQAEMMVRRMWESREVASSG